MATKPTSKIDWTEGNASPATARTEPSTGKKTTGWTVNERPAFQFMNWLFYNINEWIDYLEAVTDSPAEGVALVDNAQSPYAADTDNRTVICDTSGGSVEVDLPDAATVNGATFTVVKNTSDANTVIVDPDGAQTINGASTYVLRAQYQAVVVRSVDGNWVIVSFYDPEVERVQTLTNADSPFSATSLRKTIVCNTGGGDVEVDLPDASSIEGETFTIIKSSSDANAVIIDPNGSQTINGSSTSLNINKQWQTVLLRAQGGNWVLVATTNPTSPVASITANYTATYDDRVILADATGGAITVTLPAAANSAGVRLKVKKIDSSSNKVTLDGNGAETIDGETTHDLFYENDAIEIVCDGAEWFITKEYLTKEPTVTTYTSGSGTYTTPNGVKRLRVRMVGAGGGGGGSGTGSTGGTGGTGGNTTFGTSFLTAGGGAGGNTFSIGGAGVPGSPTVNAGAEGLSVAGSYGGPGSAISYTTGGAGGPSALGGSGDPATGGRVGGSGIANTGAGGGGGALNVAGSSGCGGGSGAFIDVIIDSPLSSYSYTVGAGGAGGSAGSSGFAGGAGAAGRIEITAYYK